MKRELLYFIGGSIVGAAISGVATYIFTKKKYEDKVNDELARMKQDAVNFVSDEYTVIKRPTESELKEEDDILKEAALDVHNRVATHIDYTVYSKSNPIKNDENGVLEVPDDYISDEYPVEDEEKIPYVIDEDAIEPGYDICYLTYYEADHTLADDASGQIVLPEDTISVKLLERFIEADEDQIFICKDSHSTVYEVTRYSGSYSREVLGLPYDSGGDENGGEHNT